MEKRRIIHFIFDDHNCERCKHYVVFDDIKTFGDCILNPVSIRKSSNDRCGQFHNTDDELFVLMDYWNEETGVGYIQAYGELKRYDEYMKEMNEKHSRMSKEGRD